MNAKEMCYFFIAQTFVGFETAAVLGKQRTVRAKVTGESLSQDKVGKVRAASLWACTVFKLERRRRREEKRGTFGRDTGVTVRSLAWDTVRKYFDPISTSLACFLTILLFIFSLFPNSKIGYS